MREITPENAAEYLRETGRVGGVVGVRARSLGWGVSNVVLRVDVDDAGVPPFVLKQARERLRTKMLWVSRLGRIWTERAAMELLGTVLPEWAVPRVLFSDEPNYLFAMTCAPDDAQVWKELLLAGEIDEAVARRAGELLGTVHAATRDHPALDGPLADTAVFDELRVDPFYRTIARAQPDVAARVDELIGLSGSSAHRCLVLGDFSPKNILVHPGGDSLLTLVDFETAHAGDPSYDLGFFLSHLWLKGLRALGAESGDGKAIAFESFESLGRAFLDAYYAHAGPVAVRPPAWPPFVDRDAPEALSPASLHLYACVLARVDGKSPVDYLDETARGIARSLAVKALRLDNPDAGVADF